MKAAEILRKLADLIDQNGDEPQATPAVDLTPVEVDNTDNTELSTMVPPLQAKLELLKKSMGMDNAYDSEATSCDSAEDAELALIKQRAGVPVAAVQEMADDEPFEG
jgi:hypothetical protein